MLETAKLMRTVALAFLSQNLNFKDTFTTRLCAITLKWIAFGQNHDSIIDLL